MTVYGRKLLAESVSTDCKTGTSVSAALLPFAGCPGRASCGCL